MPESIEPIGNSTFKISYDKDSEVEIGGDTQDFKPEAKLKRWGDECFIKVSLPTTKKIAPLQEEGKIKWQDTDKEIHFYPLDDKKFEFEVILKEKPTTNKIVLNIESQGLKFYYQPPLTECETPPVGGSVTETEVKDKDGNVLVHRPENVVGSHAVYHESKAGNYESLGGKNYRAGKAFHIYRPQMIDAKGWKVWGELKYEEGTLTTTIPQDFIDNAVYPIRHAAGETFGFEDIGGTNQSVDPDDIYGSSFTSPSDAEGASVDNITVYTVFAPNIKTILALNSNLIIVSNGISDAYATGGGVDWYATVFTTSPTLTASTAYALGVIMSGSATIKYDTGDTDQGFKDLTNDYDSPEDPSSASRDTNKYSIYATYTPVVGDVVATPSVVTLKASVQTPSPSGKAEVSPAVQTLVSSVQSPSATGEGGVSPAVQSLIASVQKPSATGKANVGAAVQSLSASIPSPSATGEASVTPAVQSLKASVQSPSATGKANVIAAVQRLVVSVIAPTATAVAVAVTVVRILRKTVVLTTKGVMSALGTIGRRGVPDTIGRTSLLTTTNKKTILTTKGRKTIL